MQTYVDGAMFSEDFKKIVLVKKNKPTWQFGKLNFVGGKIEEYENCFEAMTREFFEETGLNIHENLWDFKITITSQYWTVYFFRAVGDVTQVKTMESEEIVVVDVAELPKLNTVDNVKWITPLLLDANIRFPISFIEYEGVK